MGGVGQYAYINARIHALISSFLSDAFFERLLRAPSFEESLYSFHATGYRFIGGIYAGTGDLKMVEKALIEFRFGDMGRLKRHAPSVLHSLIAVLQDYMRYEAFKTALRLWFDHAIRKRRIADATEYLPRQIPLDGITPDDVINAPDFASLMTRVQDTPYHVIIPGLSRLPTTRTLLSAELALGNAYYRHLCDVVATFRKDEKKTLETLISHEIDSVNLERIVRVVPHMSGNENSPELYIPGGRCVTAQDFVRAITPTQRPEVFQELLERLGGATLLGDKGLATDVSDALSQLRRIQDAHQKKLYGRIKTTSLFDAGLCLVYTRLRALEVDRIIRVLYARYYETPNQGADA